jgi:hypothetical protein
MDFRITDHPRATHITDDIFEYLVIEYGNGGELSNIDVFTAERYGVYDLEHKWGIRCFTNWENFSKTMPHISELIKSERKYNKDCSNVHHDPHV